MKRLPRLLVLLFTLTLPLTVAAQSGKAKAATEEEEPQIIGMEMARSNGGYLGFNVEGLSFVLRFYDEEKKPVAPDAIRAMARWNQPQKAGQQRTVLAPAGQMLSSPPVARPPYAFTVFLTLIGKDQEVMDTVSFNVRNLPDE